MERLQAAIEKARANRGKADPVRPAARPLPGPASGAAEVGDVAAAWAALTPFETRSATLASHRVIAQSGRPDTAAFDLLRTRVRQQARDKGWSRIAVVSPHGGAGKTTTTANLSFALGRQGDTRTVALDFDLRRPAMARVLGQEVRHNMAEVILGHVGFEAHGVRAGENLAFGMNHEPAPASSELLQSQRTADWLVAMESVYRPDLVLFDMPPLMATDDGFGFLQQVDCALIVVEAEKTPISQIDVIERQVAELTNVMGVVLNKCNYVDGIYGSDYGYY